MIDSEYHEQVDLLLKILPYVAKEDGLALKGGTAINLFVQDMPRISVDIDLTYASINDSRDLALKNISVALDRIEDRVRAAIPGISLNRIPAEQGQDVKLNCQLRGVSVKVEINTVTRGILYPTRLLPTTSAVRNEFKTFVAINVVSQGELYGGKICAALDRQHPRDMFDVCYMLKSDGLSYEIKLGMIMFMISHFRPISELIRPHFLDQTSVFENQFVGMAIEPFSYKDYEQTRLELVDHVHKVLTDNDKKFLLSFETGEPDWSLFPNQNLRNLPAVQWKLRNIQRLIQENPQKHRSLVKDLEDNLSIGGQAKVKRRRGRGL